MREFIKKIFSSDNQNMNTAIAGGEVGYMDKSGTVEEKTDTLLETTKYITTDGKDIVFEVREYQYADSDTGTYKVRSGGIDVDNAVHTGKYKLYIPEA